MYCFYYKTDQCRSCQWLVKPYPQQLEDKQQQLMTLFTDIAVKQWLPPQASISVGSRNKAKMVVSGTSKHPILGIINHHNHAVDLCYCPLYSDTILQVFDDLKTLISMADLTPYNIRYKRGELKYIHIKHSRFSDQLMIKFVLRTEQKIPLLKQAMTWLLKKQSKIRVITVNIQPVHAAILEGGTEYLLTSQAKLQEKFNQIPLFICAQGFFQTNAHIAEKLYLAAQQWTHSLALTTIYDLFCGVGGFGLHCALAHPDAALIGIEIDADAISSAKLSAKRIHLKQVTFNTLDLMTQLPVVKKSAKQNLLIVNPPRRGLGEALSQYVSQLAPNYLLYSSCNVKSLIKDLAQFPHYFVNKVQLFDMFPNTAHYEVMVLLTKENK